MGDRVDKKPFFDKLPFLDKDKAMKYIIYGIIIALIFGSIMIASQSIAGNAGTWASLADQQNKQNFWDGLYGYQEYAERENEIDLVQRWLSFQQVIVVNIARLGVYLGFFAVFLGFVGFAVNENIDSKIRIISLILAAIIIAVILFSILDIAFVNNTQYAYDF